MIQDQIKDLSIIDRLKLKEIVNANLDISKGMEYHKNNVEIYYTILKDFFKYKDKPFLDKQYFMNEYTNNSYNVFNEYFEIIDTDLYNIFSEINNIESKAIEIFNLSQNERDDINDSINLLVEKLNDYSMYSSFYEKDEKWFKDEFITTNKIETATDLYAFPKSNINIFANIATLSYTHIENIINDDTIISINNPKGLNKTELSNESPYNDPNMIIDKVDSTDKSNIESFYVFEHVFSNKNDIISLNMDITIDFTNEKNINTLMLTPFIPNKNYIPYISNIQTFSSEGKWENIDLRLDNTVSNKANDGKTVTNILSDNFVTSISQTSSYLFTDPSFNTTIKIFDPVITSKIKVTYTIDSLYLDEDEWKAIMGIRDISVFSFNYENKSELISKAYVSNKPIDRISLSVTDEISKSLYQNTDKNRNDFIKYYVTFDDKIWTRLSPLEFDEITEDDHVVPEILHVNYSPSLEQIKNNKSGKFGYVDLKNAAYSFRFKAVFETNNANITPVLHSYSVQLHTVNNSKYRK